ncbi:penicillin acylase family protein [Roseiterribacter gracilis]|uniref:Penicillin amidase n=1 Tax=Roseiterribacter gracilis TaxID=2812848 RepID=A0A8S8XAK4_9PROT|nr:penicillin amidase [Rhodospirillales bacterium TMPK1]
MRRALRVLLVLVVLLLALPVVLIGWLSIDQPKSSGKARIRGLAAEVNVGFDADGIPRIRAQSETDAARALGWLHARDRLWQMEQQRRVGQGRLAEIIGSGGVAFDKLMRTLDLYRLAEASYQHLSPDLRALLDAYADGVNSFIDKPSGALPIEFQLTFHRPEKWRPADTLVWGKLMSLQLTGDYRDEITRARLLARLTPKQLGDLMPDFPDAPTTLAAIDWTRFADALPPPLGPKTASNEWVLDGTRTDSGKPLLANDPHLGLQAPALWWLARIELPNGGVRAGAFVPGSPLLILGRNDRIAWGATTTGTDTQDLFVETIDPTDPTRYRTPDGSAAFEVREERIKVRFGDDIVLRVRKTRHGPVLSDIEPRLVTDPGKVVALAFTALVEKDTTPDALLSVARARDCAGFRDAMKNWVSPQQNFTCADSDGHIGIVLPGAVPIRKAPPPGVPVDGADGAHDWVGLIPFDELPQVIDPASHKIVNANNRAVGPNYPHRLVDHWEAPYRAARIEEVLAATPKQNVRSSAALQHDNLSIETRELLPLLREGKPSTDLGRRAFALLDGWDGTMSRDKPQPLIYAATLLKLQQLLWDDELGDLATTMRGFRPEAVQRILTKERGWCDDVTTPSAESCEQQLTRSIDEAAATLAAAYGADPTQWRWGAAHRATLAHPLLSLIPGLKQLIDISIEQDGGDFTVHRQASGGSRDLVRFDSVHGAGYRGVYDLADLDRSRFALATGQSGNPLSRHWGDFVGRWRDGASVTLVGGPDEAAAGKKQLRLLP